MNRCGLGKKVYIEAPLPSEEDNIPADERVRRELAALGIEASFELKALRKLYPLCDQAGWKVTAALSWDGRGWRIVDIEAGNTADQTYGLAIDLGSTSVVASLVRLPEFQKEGISTCRSAEQIKSRCDSESAVQTKSCSNSAGAEQTKSRSDSAQIEILAEVSAYNGQIAFGEDILSRIFYGKDHPARREEIRRATLATITDLCRQLKEKTGIDSEKCLSAVISGNTTMIHLLLGLEAFGVFHEPYAVQTEEPGFFSGRELGLPIAGYVYLVPGLANYLGGDIISGLIATEFYKEEKISLFFDVGTNGELVLGNRDFLICGAGAAGPALEGGSVKTGMRAAAGAVDSVKIENEKVRIHTIDEKEAVGICGSGIVDLLAQLFLAGWVDIRGRLQEDRSPLIKLRHDPETEVDELAVEYAPGLYFYQSDIEEFIMTKAAAATMVESMLIDTGISADDVACFYMAGSFGNHVDKESAVTIGMYPDVERRRLIAGGNTSLEGAEKLLADKSKLEDVREILDKMSYVMFAQMDDFTNRMQAARALPHIDLERFPSVKAELIRRGILKEEQ